MRDPEMYREGLSLRLTLVSVTLVTLLHVVLLTNVASAFDGRRSGFILGGGVGPAYATFDYRSSYPSRAKTFGAQTAFIIGGGASDQVTISYTGLQFWGNGASGEVGFALLPSAEVRYFLSSEAPSFFGALGFGLSLYDDLGGEWNFGGGFAPHFGIGYEFARHYSFEVDLAYTVGPSGEHEPLLNLMLLFTAVAY